MSDFVGIGQGLSPIITNPNYLDLTLFLTTEN